MNRHQRTWIALILGIIAGYAVLALLFDDSSNQHDPIIAAALLFSSASLWFSLAARRRCNRQIDKR